MRIPMERHPVDRDGALAPTGVRARESDVGSREPCDAASDRVKTDRKDAELLARLLVAGQLAPVTSSVGRLGTRASA
jgi:hypothetical protein